MHSSTPISESRTARVPQLTRVFVISALTGDGCNELTFAVMEFLQHAAAEQAEHERETTRE